MIKVLIQKFNNFIQWTKKWHVCHLFIHIYMILFYFIITSNLENSNYISDKLIIISLVFYFMLYWSYPIILIVSIISHLKKKTVFISNEFLLHNKLYNLYYYLSFLTIILCVSTVCFSGLYGYCLILIILYIFSLFLFLTLKWIITSIIDLCIR